MAKKDIVIKNTSGTPITYSQVDGVVCKDTSGNDVNFTEGVALELQEKTLTVTSNGSQVINPDTGFDALSKVNLTVNVDTRKPEQEKTTNPSTSTVVVTPDEGYALSKVTVNAMPSGTAGTPVATKGTVSNNSISVTPSVTNITGYITGSTKTGTAVTVSASELVSGDLSITNSGSAQSGIDVTNYSTVSLSAVPSYNGEFISI